jgi:hypothetical protein
MLIKSKSRRDYYCIYENDIIHWKEWMNSMTTLSTSDGWLVIVTAGGTEDPDGRMNVPGCTTIADIQVTGYNFIWTYYDV